MPLTPAAFVAKWKRAKLSERAASQEHFLDLCALLNQPTPASHDSTGDEYTFEKGITISIPGGLGLRGESGFADVWWNGKFGWEYKRKGKYKDLSEAYAQLQRYREALNNPPLLIVSDIATTEIHTNFTNAANVTLTITLDDILAGPGLDLLRRAFTDPESFRPAKTTEQVTQEMAIAIGKIAVRLQQETGRLDPHDIAHFLMKCMFCLFAEDVPGLLPEKLFKKLLANHYRDPARFTKLAHDLFQTMATGGDFGADQIPYFNGGLFDDAPPIKLSIDDLGVLNLAADQDWSQIEPSILGTLFERSLDPSKRAQIGAHYTSKDDILLVINPVIIDPLRKQWLQIKSEIEADLAANPIACPLPQQKTSRGKSTPINPLTPVHEKLSRFLANLSSLKILDPACGSGNFLYVAIQQLLALEKEIITFAAQPPISLQLLPRVRPTQLLGIEINPYAAELAQVSIWIGFLQWMYLNGFPPAADTPILSKLKSIDNRDAIIKSRTLENGNLELLPEAAEWPSSHFIVGNPPFLGGNIIRQGLGDNYLDKYLFPAFDLPKFSDLCCYWFELARQKVEGADGTLRTFISEDVPLPRVGLLATQGIRGGVNREVLERIKKVGDIFNAWSDRDWILDGANVHVSIIEFQGAPASKHQLDGKSVPRINPDLTSDTDTTTAEVLSENSDVCFYGSQQKAKFDIETSLARKMLVAPNPTGESNVSVIKPSLNAKQLMGRQPPTYVIDFGLEEDIRKVAVFEAPFEYVRQTIYPIRQNRSEVRQQKYWWLHARPSPRYRTAIATLQRCLVTPAVSKHRVFVWIGGSVLVDHATLVFARSDDYFLGVLQSSIHELWARETGTQVREAESGFRYTPSTTFETFPLPWPPGQEPTTHPAYIRIAAAAKELNDLRERWLNPPELLEPLARILDAQDDFADVPPEARPLLRHSALMAQAAKSPNLKKRTLTNLYNERPTWLKLAHEKLDKAVLAAYALIDPEGAWSEDWASLYTDTGAGQPLPPDHPRHADRLATDQKILANLLRLNHQRARAQS